MSRTAPVMWSPSCARALHPAEHHKDPSRQRMQGEMGTLSYGLLQYDRRASPQDPTAATASSSSSSPAPAHLHSHAGALFLHRGSGAAQTVRDNIHVTCADHRSLVGSSRPTTRLAALLLTTLIPAGPRHLQALPAPWDCCRGTLTSTCVWPWEQQGCGFVFFAIKHSSWVAEHCPSAMLCLGVHVCHIR